MTIHWAMETRKLSDLKDYDKNPRKMEKKRFEKLIESLQQDGYHQPLLINQDNTIIGGHARKKALLKAGYSKDTAINVLIPDRLLEGEDFDRINIRDNLFYGEFDFDILANNFEPKQLVDWGMPEGWINTIDIESAEDINLPESGTECERCPHCNSKIKAK